MEHDRKRGLDMSQQATLDIVSFPDPAFTDKGLAHFALNLGLPDLAGKEQSCDNKYIHDSGWGLELKRRLGRGKFAVLQIQCLLCCSPVLEDTY